MGAAETVLHLTGNRASRSLTEARITVSTAWTVMFEDQYRYLTTGEVMSMSIKSVIEPYKEC